MRENLNPNTKYSKIDKETRSLCYFEYDCYVKTKKIKTVKLNKVRGIGFVYTFFGV